MALRIKDCWDELVKQTIALEKFQDVKAMPINRVNDAAFLKTFPGLKMPACLIVLLDGNNAALGQESKRSRHWNAIIVDSDPDGSAWEKSIELVDDFMDGVLDKQYLDNELTVNGSCDVSAAFSTPRFSIYQISFTTEEAATR